MTQYLRNSIYTIGVLLTYCFNVQSYALDMQFTPNIDNALDIATEKFKLPKRLLKALCYTESRLNPKVVNMYDGGSPSYGLCQIKAGTAKSLGFNGRIKSLYDPYVNAHLAAKYLRYQFDRYNGDWTKAVAAYNRGHAGVKIMNIKYVNKVFTQVLQYD